MNNRGNLDHLSLGGGLYFEPPPPPLPLAYPANNGSGSTALPTRPPARVVRCLLLALSAPPSRASSGEAFRQWGIRLRSGGLEGRNGQNTCRNRSSRSAMARQYLVRASIEAGGSLHPVDYLVSKAWTKMLDLSLVLIIGAGALVISAIHVRLSPEPSKSLSLQSGIPTFILTFPGHRHCTRILGVRRLRRPNTDVAAERK